MRFGETIRNLFVSISDVGAAFIGGIFGSQIHGGPERAERVGIAEAVGAQVRRAIFPPDREDVMRELLNLGEDAAAIMSLLREANEKGFVTVDNQKYTENWIISMLLKVEPRYRTATFLLLNEKCEESRKEFFSYLQIEYSNGFAQMWAVLIDDFNEAARNAITMFRPRVERIRASIQALDNKIEERIRYLESDEDKKWIGGKRRWIF
jgi:hypothetical protein